MKNKNGNISVILVSVIGLICVVVFSAWLWTMSLNKQEIRLSNRYDIQDNVIEAIYDNMWKTISDKYSLKGEYEAAFRTNLESLVRGRVGGSVFKINVESATQLNYPTDLYTVVMDTVEGKRDEMKRALQTQNDIWLEHKNFCEDPFHNILWLDFASKVKEQPIMIASDGTKAVMATKLDNFSLGGPAPSVK